ncbi:carboxymuconolactone decarboxylase family protein [Caballeronia sp. PC1]|uniref:carboxymuconolactone decarboxylase family protein n=1 Tax=Caballeronia sp. PC1 TaxID=2906765 RepID=UPI0028164F00|nr:carboxymuconolactone decarboxylase family protein [Caballeronia sp. PC1]
MITRIAWNEIWSRPGLDERTRRLIVVATTASLGRWEEYALHVRAGLAQGGFTQDELKEVLMQNAIYAGSPSPIPHLVKLPRSFPRSFSQTYRERSVLMNEDDRITSISFGRGLTEAHGLTRSEKSARWETCRETIGRTH